MHVHEGREQGECKSEYFRWNNQVSINQKINAEYNKWYSILGVCRKLGDGCRNFAGCCTGFCQRSYNKLQCTKRPTCSLIKGSCKDDKDCCSNKCKNGICIYDIGI